MKAIAAPYCAGKILAGYNDLATTRPAIMDEWSGRNKIDSVAVSEYSRQAVWWRCRDCGYSYIENYDTDIGIPISIMLPDMKIAVEFSTLRDNRIKEEVKNIICRRKGFTMVRILEPCVKKYDTCYCIQWKEKTQESLKHVLRMASYM